MWRTSPAATPRFSPRSRVNGPGAHNAVRFRASWRATTARSRCSLEATDMRLREAVNRGPGVDAHLCCSSQHLACTHVCVEFIALPLKTTSDNRQLPFEIGVIHLKGLGLHLVGTIHPECFPRVACVANRLLLSSVRQVVVDGNNEPRIHRLIGDE